MRAGAFGTAVRQALACAALALALAGCGGGPRVGVLEPVAALVPGASPETIFVATTRQRRDATPAEMFGGARAPSLDYAHLVVSVPPNHKPGELEWPASAKGDPNVSFATLERNFVNDAGFMAGVRKAVQARPPGQRTILVFIHGYNTTFDEAVYRLAQIVHDSGFKGVPVLFTWPSKGALLDYPYDRESAVYSRDDLEATLRQLARQSGATQVDLLAHSMGNMLTMETMRQAAIRGDGRFGGKLGQVMLAAPDIDIDVFRKQLSVIAPLKLPITVFVSRDDKALKVSQFVWGGQRAGAFVVSDPEMAERLRASNITVYDLSDIKTSDDLNHGKFASSPQVVQLIGRRLASDNGIATRGPGLGEGVMMLGTKLGSTIGGAAGTVVGAPASILAGESPTSVLENVAR
ncbi:esterase [Alsobacter soli]|uniref:Esterase n=1 Tax=Alsobacter soli TaxID=2109933 RepID=A0A2T1HQK3_9HYPH|nr:alpha/beta hydrolase [Alsobacter soli]PSC03935.1 esterase [Alsobacter soli]